MSYTKNELAIYVQSLVLTLNYSFVNKENKEWTKEERDHWVNNRPNIVFPFRFNIWNDKQRAEFLKEAGTKYRHKGELFYLNE